MKLGSLYSGGIDAFAYAAKKVGISVAWQVECIREYHYFLNNNYPESRKYEFDQYVGKRNLEWVEIICGGDPCQPNSTAGLRLGKADYRYRWLEMFRIIREMRPNWVINENVNGSVSNMVLDTKISDLESVGYTCQAYNIPAVSVGAVHERQRIFLVAHADEKRREISLCSDRVCRFEKSAQAITLDSQGNPFLRFEESVGEPAVFPVDDGIPNRLLRLEAAGDSIVSPIPIILLAAIKQIKEMNTVE